MGNSATVDPKGRLKIPAPLLPTLKRSGVEFYITSEDGGSVRIYPMRIWNQVEDQLQRQCPQNRNSRKLLLRAKYFGQVVAMDKQGRLLIPIVLRSTAQMKGAVDVLDYASYLEVWNHARFLKTMESSPITKQDQKTLNKLSSAPRLPLALRETKEEERAHEIRKRFRVHRQARPNPHRRPTHAIRGARTDPASRARVA